MGTYLVYVGIDNTQQQEVNPCPLQILYAITGAGFKENYFPRFRTAVGSLLKNHQRFVIALGIICPEDFTLRISQRDGRPLCDRINLVRAFIAKAIWDC